MIFSSLPFHGIPLDAAADCSHTFSRCRLLTAYQATTPHIPIPSIESHHFPSVVFTRVCNPRSRPTDFSFSLSSSFVFRCLRRRHSSSAKRTLFSNQSSLPLVPFPGNWRPRRFKQQCWCWCWCWCWGPRRRKRGDGLKYPPHWLPSCGR